MLVHSLGTSGDEPEGTACPWGGFQGYRIEVPTFQLHLLRKLEAFSLCGIRDVQEGVLKWDLLFHLSL